MTRRIPPTTREANGPVIKLKSIVATPQMYDTPMLANITANKVLGVKCVMPLPLD
jgi:hypothetical protein